MLGATSDIIIIVYIIRYIIDIIIISLQVALILNATDGTMVELLTARKGKKGEPCQLVCIKKIFKN